MVVSTAVIDSVQAVPHIYSVNNQNVIYLLEDADF